MKTGFHGTYLISWSQTEIDGLHDAPVGSVRVGSTWRWDGQPTRVDSGRDVLILENPIDETALRLRAAKSARKFLGASAQLLPDTENADADRSIFSSGFDLTDGYQRFRVTLIDTSPDQKPMIMFVGPMPPAGQDLWVVNVNTDTLGDQTARPRDTSVVCFVDGTRIRTSCGDKRVDELMSGDLVQTKDNGLQPIRWIGQRRVTGARLYAMPQMRPIRLRAHILGQGEPDQDLLVSPDHRILIKGPMAQSLFNTQEVLVAARHLVNDRSITPDRSVRSLNYVHLMLDRHEILFANGVECDSFHPAGADLDQIEPQQCRLLLDRFPDVAQDAFGYGEYARRCLSASEAAVLAYQGQQFH